METCAQRIEKTVGKLPGVQQASVNLASEKLFVEYEPETVAMEDIQKAVEKIGYEAVEKTDVKTVTVPIGGMGMIWRWIYDGDYGLLNYVLGTHTIWLGERGVVWPALLFVSLWKGLPYATLMFLAGLQGIPGDLYEAAYVDGCGKWKQFINITLPMLSPVILVTALTSIVQSWTKFEVIWVLTGGGPGYATSILPTYIYSKSFKDFQMGMGSTVSVVAMLVMMVFVVLYLRVYNKSAEKVG